MTTSRDSAISSIASQHIYEDSSGKPPLQPKKLQRLQQGRHSDEQRVDDVKEMLKYFMRCPGLKRLEGELNKVRMQTDS